ncbi:WD40-repeat-containing domain protein [Phlebopus sp. FC_14]|nr:WD40-repeat-containing domain protein [Phlebopus sp. FC_14]
MTSVPPPSPLHVLRTHTGPVSVLFFSSDNERIYSGDAKGRVAITSSRTLRAIANWAAHSDALLGVEELENQIISHGRDNKIHVWERPREPESIREGAAASLTDLSIPSLRYSLDVNALNYCRFSLLPMTSQNNGPLALIALPNLVESSLADIWTLPDCSRLHAAIGDPQNISTTNFSDGRSGRKTAGIVMSIHLFHASQTSPSTSKAQRELRLLCAYEDGGVILRRRTSAEDKKTVEGRGWEVIWRSRLHVESVMAMVVSKDSNFALTVSADHLVGKYDLVSNASGPGISEMLPGITFQTKHPGNASIAIRDDGRVCAIGGWDGKVRLYSTKTFKPLGTLVYHKESCQALMFASPFNEGPTGDDGASDEDADYVTVEEKRQRSRWLIAAGRDTRVSIWRLMSFAKV